MLQVQKFIKEHGIMALAKEPLNIKIKAYEELNIYVLNYDQIESPKCHPIVVECRSLIVDKDGNILSRSFDRFFNHGEVPDYYHDFDLNRSTIFTKEDGSLIKLWFCAATNQWEISTRSQAFAEGPHVMGGTFRTHVLNAMKLSEEQFQIIMNRHANRLFTYIQEFVGRSNRVVTVYDSDYMVQLCVRNNRTGEEFLDNTDLLKSSMNIIQVKSWDLSSLEEIQEACKNLPNLGEGYVCYDSISKKRCKIKSPLYVQIHHMRGNGTPSLKRFYMLVLMGETKEYLQYFSGDYRFIEPIEEIVEEFKQSLQTTWDLVKHIEDQKEFALIVKDSNGSQFLFSAKKLKKSPVEIFNSTNPERLLKLFNIKDEIVNE